MIKIPPALNARFAVFNHRGGYSSLEIEADAKLKNKQWNLFTKIWLRKGKVFLEGLE